MLTQRQENFTLCLYKGESEYDAWGNAGYSTNYSRAAIYVNACRLANSTKVKLRLAELRQPNADKSIATVDERKEKLTEVLRDKHKVPLTAREKVYAIAELNKMSGDYAPERSEVEVIQTFVFILPDGTRVKPKELKDATKQEEEQG